MAKKSNIDRGNLPTYEYPPTYQEKVDLARADLTTEGVTTKESLAVRLRELRREEDILSEQVEVLNVKQEAIGQMLTEILDDEGIRRFSLKDGYTFYQEQRVMASVPDRETFHDWIRENGLSDLFTIHSSTASSLIKERLESGQEKPPGTEVVLKTTIKMKKPSQG